MHEFKDPQTALAIAHYTRSDRIREVAEHQRYRDALRSASPAPTGARFATRRPFGWFRSSLKLVKRDRAIGTEVS
jgi:hypothetical protein